MANTNLSEWIKKKEAEGHSAEQILEYLSRFGYKEEDIAKSKSGVTKDENKPPATEHAGILSIPIIVLSVICFLTMSIVDGQIVFRAYILICLAGYLTLSYFAVKRDWLNTFTITGKILYLILVAIGTTALFSDGYVFNSMGQYNAAIYSTLALIAIGIAHSLYIVMRKKNSINFHRVFISLLAIGCISSGAGLVCYLILAYAVIPAIGTIPYHVIGFPLCLIPLSGILCYIHLSSWIVQVATNNETYLANRKYKALPESILNPFFPVDGSDKGYRARAMIVMSSILILMTLLGTALIEIKYSESVSSLITGNHWYQLPEPGNQYYGKLMNLGYEKHSNLRKIQNYAGQNLENLFLRAMYDSGAGQIGSIFFDCDGELSCSNITYKPSAPLDEQVPISQDLMIVSASKTRESADIYMVKEESNEDAITHDRLENDRTGLRDLEISKELNKSRYSYDLEAINHQKIKYSLPSTTWEKLIWGVSGKAMQSHMDELAFISERSQAPMVLVIAYISAREEYNWTLENSRNGRPFYDNTNSTKSHLAKLESGTEEIYKIFTQTNLSRSSAPLGIISAYSNPIEAHTDIYKQSNDIVSTQLNRRLAAISDFVNDIREWAPGNEDELSRIVRLKMEEDFMVDVILEGCGSPRSNMQPRDCRGLISGITNNPFHACQEEGLAKSSCVQQRLYADKFLCGMLATQKERDACVSK